MEETVEWHFQADAGSAFADDVTVQASAQFFSTAGNFIRGEWSTDGITYTEFHLWDAVTFRDTFALSNSGFTGGSDLFIRFTLHRESGNSIAVQLLRSSPGTAEFVVTGSVNPVIVEGTSPPPGTGLATVPLTVVVAGTGSGQVISSPVGIDCGSDCSEAYPIGTTVTLTALPDASSTFTGWQGVNCSTSICEFDMQFAGAVTATFDLKPPGGTAEPDPTPVPSADSGEPDLVGTITKVKGKVKSSGQQLTVKQEICNEGDGPADPFALSLFLSNNDTLDADDELLETFMVEQLDSSTCIKHKFKVKNLSSLDDRFALVALDFGEDVAESNETNNLLVAPLNGLFLSKGKRTPGQFIIIADNAIEADSTVEVTFTGPNGYVVSAMTDITTDGQAKIAVPPFVDLTTFTFTAGTVSVSISGSSGSAKLKIQELPEVDAEPGKLTRLLIGFMFDNFDSTEDNLDVISGETGQDFSELLDSIAQVRTIFQGMDSELAGQQLTLDTDSDPIVLSPEDLLIMDRMAAAYILGLAEELESGGNQATLSSNIEEQASQRAQTKSKGVIEELIGTEEFNKGIKNVRASKSDGIAKIQLGLSYLGIVTGVTGLVAGAVGATAIATQAAAVTLVSIAGVTVLAAGGSYLIDFTTNVGISFGIGGGEKVDAGANAMKVLGNGVKSFVLVLGGTFSGIKGVFSSVLSLADDSKTAFEGIASNQATDKPDPVPTPEPTTPEPGFVGTLVAHITISGPPVSFTPTAVLGTTTSISGEGTTICNIPIITAFGGNAGDINSSSQMQITFDPRLVTGPGDWDIGLSSGAVPLDQMALVSITFVSPDNVGDDGLSILFVSTGGIMGLTTYDIRDGGRMTGIFTATVQDLRSIVSSLNEDDEMINPLTGTITGEFDVPVTLLALPPGPCG